MLLSQVYKDKIIGPVVDEAHCVKTWRDIFRTAFAELRSLLPSGVSVMALTATTITMTYHVNV